MRSLAAAGILLLLALIGPPVIHCPTVPLIVEIVPSNGATTVALSRLSCAD